MKGDFSRFTFDRRKRYTGVRLQQGRVQLDADWNEQDEIAAYQRQTLATDVLGPAGAPEAGGGFLVSVSSNASNNKLQLSAGRFYLDGLLCENDSLVTLDAQPDLPGVALPTANGNYLAYLDVWQRSVSALEDLDLLEPALGGPDTAARVRTVWQVRLISFSGSVPAGWQPDPRPEPQLAARLHPVSQDSAASRENRLYRVEIHERAQLDSAGNVVRAATYKWSRDNGAVAASIENPESVEGGARLVLTHQIGPEQAFQSGQWLEVTDEGRVLRGEPGAFAPISSVAGQVIQVSGWPDPDDPMPSFSGAAIVRLWDSVGAVAVPATTDYQQLDDTLEVRFSANAKDYRTGDYWLIPVRAAAGVLWPVDGADAPLLQPRQGVRHHCAPLARLSLLSAKWSVTDATLRKTFPQQTNLVAKLNRASDDTMTASLTIQGNLTVQGKVTATTLDTPATPASTSLTVKRAGVDRLIAHKDGVDVLSAPATVSGKQVVSRLKVNKVITLDPIESVEIKKKLVFNVHPGQGRVLTSDGSGNATWQSLPSFPDQRFVVPDSFPTKSGDGPKGTTNWKAGPSSARAVLLYATMGSGVTKITVQALDTTMHFVRADTGSTWYVQFICPLDQGGLNYQVDAASSGSFGSVDLIDISWSIRAIGYFP